MPNFIRNPNMEHLDVIRDVAFGIHSNIPLCCITFWILKYAPSCWANTPFYKKYFKKIQESKGKWHYVPCPECSEK